MKLLAPGFMAVVGLGIGLAACGSGTHSTIPAASQGTSQSAAGSSRTTTVTLKIDVPMTGSGQTRHPKYLSPATSSLAYIVTDSAGTTVIGENCLNLGSAVQSCQTPLPTSPPVTEFAPVSTCQSQGLAEPVSCSVTYDLPGLVSTGTYTFTIATYDNTLAAACDPRPASATSLCTTTNRHVLSLASFPQSLTAGTSNIVEVTLGGVPASIAVRPFQTGYLQSLGSQLKLWGSSAQQVTVEALDADNNIIVGAGAPSLSVSGSGTTALNVTAASSVAPNVFTLQAPPIGSPPAISPGIVDLTFTATLADGATYPGSGSPNTLTTTVPVTVAHSVLFVSDSNSSTGAGIVYEYYDGNKSGTPNATITVGAASSSIYPSALAVDANGTLYVGTTQAPGQVQVYPAGSTTPSETLLHTGSFTLQSLATDASGNLYVGDANAEQIVAFTPGSVSLDAPFLTISGTNTGIDQPTGLAVGADGTVYVADSSNGSVTTYAATTGSTITSATVNLIDGYLGAGAKYLAVNAGTLFVSPPSLGKIDECPLPLFSASDCTAIQLNPGVTTTTGVTVDAAGTVYVVDSQFGTVKMFLAGSTSSTVVVSGLLAPPSPNFLAVVPRAVVP